MESKEILSQLPYAAPFLFVDELHSVTEESIEGAYTFRAEAPFYQGHFKNNPITPGVLLTECCAQIGLVCMGIYLLGNEVQDKEKSTMLIAMSSSEMEFYLPVMPNESVRVVSEKVYFRFNKLKCKIKMYNADNQLVCKGVLSGMFKQGGNGK